MNLQCYGYLLGEVKLLYDSHRDEIFIERTGVVVMENKHWLYDFKELIAIASELTGED